MLPPSPNVRQTKQKWRTEGGGQIFQQKGRQHREKERLYMGERKGQSRA